MTPSVVHSRRTLTLAYTALLVATGHVRAEAPRGEAEALAAARPPRRRGGEPQRLAARPVRAPRGGRIFPRPRHGGRQGDGGDLRHDAAANEAGGVCPRPRPDPRADRRRGERR